MNRYQLLFAYSSTYNSSCTGKCIDMNQSISQTTAPILVCCKRIAMMSREEINTDYRRTVVHLTHVCNYLSDFCLQGLGHLCFFYSVSYLVRSCVCSCIQSPIVTLWPMSPSFAVLKYAIHLRHKFLGKMALKVDVFSRVLVCDCVSIVLCACKAAE